MPYWTLDCAVLTRISMIQLLKELGHDPYYEKKRNLELLDEIERGILQYKRHNILELRKFARGRQIDIKGVSRKKEIIQVLEENDKVKTFIRFQELPVELRLQIYKYSMSQLTDDTHSISTHAQHAITRVSHLIRNESLPIFYSTNRFMLVCERRLGTDGEVHQRPTLMTDAFLRLTNKINLVCVRKLTLRFHVGPKDLSTRQPFSFDVRVDLTSAPQVCFRIVSPFTAWTGSASDIRDRRLHKIAKRQIIRVIWKLHDAVGIGKFGGQELEAIVKACTDRFSKHKEIPSWIRDTQVV